MSIWCTSQRASLKRRRGVTRMGYAAGCSFLIGSAHAGTLSAIEWGLGTVWYLPDKVAKDDHYHHGNRRLEFVESGDVSDRFHGESLKRTSIRQLAVMTHLQAAVGEWSACSTECKRTRTVLCESMDFKIVPDHLCGDELPQAEEHCETGGCVAVGAGDDDPKAEAKEGAAESMHSNHEERLYSKNSHAEADASKTRGGKPDAAMGEGDGMSSEDLARVSPGKVTSGKLDKSSGSGIVAKEEAPGREVVTGVPEKQAKRDRRDPGTAEHASNAKSNADAHAESRIGTSGQGQSSSFTTNAESSPTGRGHETGVAHHTSGDNTRKSHPSASGRETSPIQEKTQKSAENMDSNRNDGGDEHAEEDESQPHSGHLRLEPSSEERAAAGSRNVPSEALPEAKRSSPQGEHVSSSAKPNLSARPNVAQRIDRMGGGSGSARDSQQRSWVVLGIGVGAIGSFLAAVAFAVGQYQKEQHRLRGIMALNELPVDDYVNPFCAKEYSEEERSAFKL